MKGLRWAEFGFFTRIAVVLAIALGFSTLPPTLKYACADSDPQASADVAPADTEEEILERLLQSVGFELECEPLREVFTFLTCVTGIDFLVDEGVFEQFGKKEDCFGKPLERNEIFINMRVKELPLETVLGAMLRQRGLAFSIEGDHIYVAAPGDLPEWTPQPAIVGMQAEAKEKARKELLQSVAFEFDCEPLRDVITFLRTITGIDILVDEGIFEDLGEKEDCFGKPTERREIYISIHVSELPVVSALHGMLRQHDLGFSVEPGYIYVTSRDKLPEPFPHALVESASSESEERIRKELSEPISFDFECESLRGTLRFLTTITGVNIIEDKSIYERLGKKTDCHGNSVRRKDIFSSFQAIELPLESALTGILQPHGLAFSMEGDYVYISAEED